ncbi:Melatonin- receptor [Gaertneriomyces sp. JEL0708]|nr:Melatonin- receptor [Gaertneriomyces sp. JEL0708]
MSFGLVDNPLPLGTEAKDYDLNTLLRWNPFAYRITLILLVIAVLAIILNLFILYLGATDRELRSPANLLVLSLSFTDFCVGFYELIHYIPTLQAGGWSLGRAKCEVHGFLIVFVEAQSLFNMLALAWERYCSIVRREPLTKRDVVKIVCSLWVASAVIASVQWWAADGQYVLQSSLISVGAALFTVALLYYRIYRNVRGSFRAFNRVARSHLGEASAHHGTLPPLPATNDNRGRSSIQTRDRESQTIAARQDELHGELESSLTRKTLVIVLVFWTGWAPYMASFLYESISKRQSPQGLDGAAAIMVIINSLWNPFLFIFLDSRWKNAARIALRMRTTSSVAALERDVTMRSSNGPQGGRQSTIVKRPLDTRTRILVDPRLETPARSIAGLPQPRSPVPVECCDVEKPPLTDDSTL